MTHARTWALVPLRQLAGGKERLAAVLDPAARRALVEAMAEDVVEALLAVPLPPAQVLLVSEDPEVGALAERLGVGLFRPAPVADDPLNAALVAASRSALASGADSVLLIHADLPAASATALRGLLAAHLGDASAAARATLVSDGAGTGTNCLLLSPPLAMPLRFGSDSRALHCGAAAATGVDYRELTCPGLGFDVDLPADLDLLVRPAETQDNATGARTLVWIQEHAAHSR